jgi:hypothetical protein
MGRKWVDFLIKPLDLIGMWCGEDQRANINDTCLEEIGLYLQILVTTLHLIVNTIGGHVYQVKNSTNVHFQ